MPLGGEVKTSGGCPGKEGEVGVVKNHSTHPSYVHTHTHVHKVTILNMYTRRNATHCSDYITKPSEDTAVSFPYVSKVYVSDPNQWHDFGFTVYIPERQ